MKIYHGLKPFEPPAAGIVLMIGNFDGVHLGHQRLVEAAGRKAGELQLPAVALTFEPHPLAILAPQNAPARLTTFEEKVAVLGALGVDAMIVVRSDPELLGQTAERFLTDVVACCRPRLIVEGPTFNFGRSRAGSVQTLREHADRLGFAVTAVDELHSDGLPGQPAISSSAIRQALREGRIADANAMLGRPYRITGVVVRGQRRGITFDFPTANLAETPHLLPREAVYVAVAQLADDSLRLSLVNIGPQPTFGQDETRVEAHLLDFAGDVHGQRVGLHLLATIRAQIRFKGSAELAAQLHRDAEQARGYSAELARMRSAPPMPL